MQGHFSSHTLAEIFRDLYLGESGGTLHLSRGTTQKQISFDRGMIVTAESNADDEDIGKRLLADGRISTGALAEARRSITDSRELAQALVNRGLVSKSTINEATRGIVEAVVRSVFRWEGGTARFAEGGGSFHEVFDTDILATFEVILKGISTMVGFEPIKEAMRTLDNRLVIRQPTPVPLERLTLSPAHGFILSRVDGSTTVHDVLSILPHGEEDLACRFLYGLLVMGVAAYDPPVGESPFKVAGILRSHADQIALEKNQEKLIAETYEGMRSKTPYQILGLAASAPRDVVERAYEDAKERFSRDRILPRVRDKFRAEMAVIESRLVEAYLTLSQTSSLDMPGRREDSGAPPKEAMDVDGMLVRVEMDKTKTKMALEENARVADAYYNKARKYTRDGDHYNAIQYGKLAISYNPDDARFYYLLGDCHARNPEARWQRLAEQNYVKATELDPGNAEYRIGLGRFYKRRGLKLRARKQFEWALEIVPGHGEAVEELATLA
jgi:tetratricopeptide (TPR) repeat protein